MPTERMSLSQSATLSRDAAAPDEAQTATRRRTWIIAGIITLGALALRLFAIEQSLPFIDHPDEPNPINYVVEMLRTGDPNQHFFQKPSLYIYLLLSVLSTHYHWGLATGIYSDINQMHITTHVVTTIPGFFYWSRIFTSVIGGLTVAFIYRAGARIWSSGAGIVAALFAATLPFHIRFSQYITTDVTSAFLVLMTVAAAFSIVRTGRWQAYLVAGAFSGFAASTKYNAGIVALAVIAAHAIYWKRRMFIRLPLLVFAGLASIAGFLVGTPYALLSWSEFSQGISGQWGAYDGGSGHYQGAWNIGGYAEFFWEQGLLPTGIVATIGGLALWLRRRPQIAAVWLSFAIPSLLLHLSRPSHFMQNMLPLIVLCALPVGVSGAAAIDWLGRKVPHYRAVIATGVLVTIMLSGSVASAQHAWRLAQGDTRVQMLDWIAANVPPGMRIAAEVDPIQDAGESRWTEVHYAPEFDRAWYRRQGYAYVIASSNIWRQWAIPAAYTDFAEEPPVAEFGGVDPLAMLGPRLVVYATGLSAEDVPERPANTIQLGSATFLGLTIGELEEADALQRGLGIRQQTRTFRAGSVLGLRTFWQIQQPFDDDYFIFIHIQDANDAIVAQRDAPPWQGRYPTTAWQPGSLVVDVNDVPLSPDLPPGEYTLTIGMFNPTSGTHPPALIDGEPANLGAVPMGKITIVE